ncbi:TPA: trp operon leader peptide [Salmonella enterica]|nr:trp operon leader peptide [Salmonella enterica]HDD1488931.1 trp operon leader peptide [Salmonella enterica]HDD1500666.1 trp operon leader peptide [Salmonella enterica]HEA0250545.1 trp operon leader peptide [Salmonella enterica]HEA0389176.1 trp operon leader peptide [Salmonella enterica]
MVATFALHGWWRTS